MKTDIEILMGVLEDKKKSWWSSYVFTPQNLIDILLEFTKEKERLQEEEIEAEYQSYMKRLEGDEGIDDLTRLQNFLD